MKESTSKWSRRRPREINNRRDITRRYADEAVYRRSAAICVTGDLRMASWWRLLGELSSLIVFRTLGGPLENMNTRGLVGICPLSARIFETGSVGWLLLICFTIHDLERSNKWYRAFWRGIKYLEVRLLITIEWRRTCKWKIGVLSTKK